jgi:hypothetical protein
VVHKVLLEPGDRKYGARTTNGKREEIADLPHAIEDLLQTRASAEAKVKRRLLSKHNAVCGGVDALAS